ncbi:uncharacterized protein BT62DRAFT_1007023 [Guyanagaster necrorhizus]|uniref:Uncharacterized protein n=1 Tax=Guyanagaster necrorhizus TaxID=856835 RepID=A0A9P7VQ27_9AGAR|nr:uncharacterized protein BT62DRAFT_1007023 [Guyanagaster necrorhizus MCA 3950]KAG7445318.1 hypothetical protein BT62DRAFT_1007023 [Guyanagaster necrorhizus MCA 3950]
MSSSPRSLHDWPELFTRMCSSTVSAGMHCVTFQPTPGTPNQDRFVAQEWDLDGRRWKFLAVLDGTNMVFPFPLEDIDKIEGLKKNCTGSLSDTRGGPEKRYTKRVQEILSCQIYYFDKGIGDAIEELCPDSSLLDDEQARNLVNTTKNVFQRALFAGLGDSTVGLAYTSPEGYGNGERLLTLHSTHTPLEYFTIVMRHPTTEKTTIIQDECLLDIALPT